MNQYDVNTFLTVVRCRSFSKAAEILFSTQATISHRISGLEQELGYSLLNRRKGLRDVELTPQGVQFVPIAEQWSALWDSSLAIKDPEYRPLLTIGATNRLITHILPPFFQTFSESHAEIALELRSYHSVEVAQLIDRKELDVGFISSPIHIPNVTMQPFLKEEIVMICPKGNYYCDRIIHPDALSQRDEIRLSSNAEIDAWHQKWWDSRKQPSMYVDSAMMAVTYLIKPQSWSLCPGTVAKSLTKSFPIEIHNFSVEVPSQMSYIIYHQSPRLEKIARISALKKAFAVYYAPLLVGLH